MTEKIILLAILFFSWIPIPGQTLNTVNTEPIQTTTDHYRAKIDLFSVETKGDKATADISVTAIISDIKTMYLTLERDSTHLPRLVYAGGWLTQPILKGTTIRLKIDLDLYGIKEIPANASLHVDYDLSTYGLTDTEKQIEDDKKKQIVRLTKANSISKEKLKEEIKSLPDPIRQLVISKKIILGMNERQVILAWGRPQQINTSIGSWGKHEQWVYGIGTYVYFTNGIVDSIQNSH